MKDQGSIRNKSIYLALGVSLTGEKELLGLWVSPTEGAKFWLQVLTELRNRGVTDILIACVDGLTGFPEAIETAFPQTQVQLCIVHQVRNGLNYVSYKDRKAVAADLKKIYKSATIEEAEEHLAALGQTWNERYPTIYRSWDKHWEQLTGFFAYPPEIRKVIYTTNAIESLNSSMRKILKVRRAFPNDEAATKLMYLALKMVSALTPLLVASESFYIYRCDRANETRPRLLAKLGYRPFRLSSRQHLDRWQPGVPDRFRVAAGPGVRVERSRTSVPERQPAL